MSVAAVDEQKVSEFAASLRGRVVRPGDGDYDDVRKIWNGMIDKHPQLIAQCADAGDVMTAVTFARENGLPVSVRGGGHNVAGTALVDDGMVIDLSLLREVHIDSELRTARAGGGVLWGEMDRAAQQHGLAVNGGVISTTGIGGLTLGGGIGWLNRKFGLTCDSLIAAEVVTAEGKIVRASAEAHPDLLFGLRGGGGNFGIVTEFTYRLQPVGPMVLGGMLVWPLDQAEQVYRFYREYTNDLADELTTMASLVTAPAAPFVPPEAVGMQCIAIIGCYSGSVEQGSEVMAPLRELRPAMDIFTERPYVEVQSMLDGLAPAGVRNYWKSEFLNEISDELMQVLIDRFRAVPSPMTHVDLHHLAGAISRVKDDETAFSHRDANYTYNIVSAWTDPADDERNIAWTRGLWNDLRPYALGASYVNFAPPEGEDKAKADYGEAKYQRLAELKRKYDPSNFFRQNHNIKPAA